MTNGFHENLPAAQYFALPNRVSKSVLMAHRKSSAHAYHAMNETVEQTAGMRMGSLVHTLVLEPGELNARYAVGPDAARNTKEWKEWAAAQVPGRELIKGSEYAEACAMARWIERKPTISRLIRGAGPVEASVLWSETDRLTGVTLDYRARPDKLVQSPSILVDLKTTADISDRGIERTILSFGYHLQMALYMQGLAAVGKPVDHAVIVWVENVAPYEARATLLNQLWIDIADAELAVLKVKHAECVAQGEWPGFEDAITDVDPPAWMLKGEMI